jgi:hypothetical protein
LNQDLGKTPGPTNSFSYLVLPHRPIEKINPYLRFAS